MAGVRIPKDRTTKQPAAGCCYNPACREDSEQERFEFVVENDHFACPKCGANKAPYVHLMALTHMLIPDPLGMIVGVGGLKYSLGCDSKRAYIATVTNQEAASGEIEAVNCPGCLAEAGRRGIVLAGQSLWAKE